MQEEGLDSEVGCLIRFYAGKAVTCTRAARALGPKPVFTAAGLSCLGCLALYLHGTCGKVVGRGS